MICRNLGPNSIHFYIIWSTNVKIGHMGKRSYIIHFAYIFFNSLHLFYIFTFCLFLIHFLISCGILTLNIYYFFICFHNVWGLKKSQLWGLERPPKLSTLSPAIYSPKEYICKTRPGSHSWESRAREESCQLSWGQTKTICQLQNCQGRLLTGLSRYVYSPSFNTAPLPASHHEGTRSQQTKISNRATWVVILSC